MTEQIKQLSINFQKENYPFETDAQKIERQKLVDEQGGWGIVTIDSGSGSIENTIEIPTAPQTIKGLKFHAAAKELSLINDKFFKLRNHNPLFKSTIKKLKDDIKAYRKSLDDSDEIASDYAKNIVKLQEELNLQVFILLML